MVSYPGLLHGSRYPSHSMFTSGNTALLVSKVKIIVECLKVFSSITIFISSVLSGSQITISKLQFRLIVFRYTFTYLERLLWFFLDITRVNTAKSITTKPPRMDTRTIGNLPSLEVSPVKTKHMTR